jgi:hypothetical protein
MPPKQALLMNENIKQHSTATTTTTTTTSGESDADPTTPIPKDLVLEFPL